MADIHLIQCTPLSTVDRSGVAMLDAVKFSGLTVRADNKRHLLRLVALGGVKRDGDALLAFVIDLKRRDRSDAAIG
jgi:hypothetical protein